ncbi:MAG: S1 RNA-binding domain-containing protein [Acidobacteriia bacterium]|nr:S1 RNA-binding domain-containing protein [Terriglobia bacterium]
MTQPKFTDAPDAVSTDSSFGDILTQFEQAHRSGGETLEGTVVSVTPEAVFVDLGRKMDGVITPDGVHTYKKGDKVLVSIRGRDEEGNYQLSTIKVETPRDWSGLEAAFAAKKTIGGTVLEVVKGGLRVDVGVRAFMPASRSGAREQADLEKLVGQQIECRITKLDTASEDVVVDRRVVLEELERHAKAEAFASLEEGAIVRGTVRSIMDFGAFLDIGGVDGLLHVSDMSYARGLKPAEIVKIGDVLDVKILKINRDTRKIGLGLKQLQPDPWSVAAEKYPAGSRVRGKVARVADFGAFVELEPGVEGLIHVSEMSWTRKNVRPDTIVKVSEAVEVVVLGVNLADKRIALGLKQALGDPWEEALKKYPVGEAVEAPVVSLAKFGAFVDLGDGIEGMIHIGDISHEKRLNHPSEALKVGEKVKAQVLEADKERRRLRLGIKQLIPTSIDEYIAEHKPGDSVSGRLVDVSGSKAKVELGEGVFATAKLPEQKAKEASASSSKADLSALSAMLAAKWKSGGGAEQAADAPKAGQVRSFKIVSLDPAQKKIELELA